jgi:hypothetical protein
MRQLLLTFILISSLFAPIWAVIILAGITSFRYRLWELLLIGLFIDFIYLPTGGFMGFPYIATVISLILVWGLEPLRSQLIFK